MPAGVVFEVVFAWAFRSEVGGVGVAAFAERDDVIDFAAAGVAVAVRSAAGAVARGDVVDEVLGWPVFLPPVVDQVAEVVGDQPGPGAGGVGGHGAGEVGGDGSVAGQLTGLLIEPQQCR